MPQLIELMVIKRTAGQPAQYAAAGIPYYWRVEREVAPVLVTHELEGRAYREAGRFTDEVVVERPVELRFQLDQLLP